MTVRKIRNLEEAFDVMKDMALVSGVMEQTFELINANADFIKHLAVDHPSVEVLDKIQSHFDALDSPSTSTRARVDNAAALILTLVAHIAQLKMSTELD